MRRGNQTWEGQDHNIYDMILENESLSSFAEYEFKDQCGDMENVPGKGNTNALISMRIFEICNEAGIYTHFAGAGTTSNSIIVWKSTKIPIKIVVTNVVTERFCQLHRGRITEGTQFKEPVVEFFQKGNIISTSALLKMQIISLEELDQIQTMLDYVNSLAKKFFDNLGLTLAEFEAEIGRDYRKVPVLAGTFTGNTCTIWDTSEDPIDKNVFKKGKVLDEEAAVYRKMMQILENII